MTINHHHQARTQSTQSFDNRLEDEPDIELESVVGDEKPKKRFPYQKIGISFLVIAIVVAIITITVPAALVNKIRLFDDAIIFRLLFATFLFCLFVCLWCIYYLGGEVHAWEDPEGNDLSLNFSNITAIIGIVIEFVQLCSFSWNQDSQYLGSEVLRNSNYLAIPFSPGSVYSVMYWIMFGVAFTPYIFVVFVRLLLHFFTRRFGEAYTANFVTKYQQKIYSILWFLVNTLYLPIISTMLSGFDCTLYSDTNTMTMDANQSISCFHPQHVPFIVCSLVALLMYYPAASFAQSQTQNISDIKFKPRVVFIFVQGKVILAALTLFLTTYKYIYLSAVLIVNLAFLIINVWLEPCIVEWVSRMRTVFFTFCTIATITSWIGTSKSVPYSVPLILLIIGWISVAVLAIIFYQFNFNTKLYNTFNYFIHRKTPPSTTLNLSKSHSSDIVASHPNDSEL